MVRWRFGFISSFFFFNDTATTEIYTLSLHDALPICTAAGRGWLPRGYLREKPRPIGAHEHTARAGSAGCVAVRSRRSIVCGPGPGVCAGGAPVEIGRAHV